MNGVLIYHVTPNGLGWAVEAEEDGGTLGAFADKGTALRHGQELARQARGQLVVHREDGSIHAEHRY